MMITTDIKDIKKDMISYEKFLEFEAIVKQSLEDDEQIKVSKLKINSILAPNETITNIKLIVPNKVIEVTFCDGMKEKLVCSKDDIFDLKKGCFIAIAKHLYKSEYTYEGIEFKAKEISMKKKYVKMVERIVKTYIIEKSIEEKEDRLKKEQLEVEKRRKEKKIRQRERRLKKREEKEREEMISIITEAIQRTK